MHRRFAILIGGILAITAALAQSPAPSPTFEVAAIKPNVTGNGNSGTTTNKGEILMENVSLKGIIQNAYDVRNYSFSGPDWLNTVRFDITAKFPTMDESLPRQERQAQLRQMMQNLLAERFKLVVHRETKTMGGYALVVDKKGPRLKDSEKKDG